MLLPIKRINTLWKNVLQYIFAAIFSLILFVLITHAWNLNLSIPFFYSWDSLFSGFLIKSMIDVGGYMTNPYIGAPNGFNLADFPINADNFNFLIIKVLSYFTKNYAVILNVYYILTFPLTTLMTLAVFKRIGLQYPFALAASLLFTLLPYHFLRGAEGHLFLAAYFVIPLIAWLCILIATNKFSPRLYRHPYLRCILYLLFCSLIGSTGIYYAFFGLFFILASGIIVSINNRKFAPIGQAALLSILISLTLAANLAPSIIYRIHQGVNQAVAARAPAETELYGLKIAQLLLPIDNDRLSLLAKLKNKYNASAPLITKENSFSTLGIVSGIGFLILLAVIILGVPVTEEINILSKLNLCGVLLATIGGFGTLLSYTIFSTIRCYGRISIFLAFFSLYAFFYFAQKLVCNYSIFKKASFTWLFAILMASLGIFNQTVKGFSDLQSPEIAANFNNDEKFVRKIEATMPPDSMIYQLPYVPFPEHPPVLSMRDYEHFRAYLHSHSLKWSYGAIKGRPVSIWQNGISILPTEKMTTNLSVAGYSGIYIDRNGYSDHGAKIEKEISTILNQKPMISENNNFSFFDMRHYAATVKNSGPVALWDGHSTPQPLAQKKISLSWNKGFYSLEVSGANKWHWSNKQSVLAIVNYTDKPLELKLSFKAVSGDSNVSTLTLTSPLITKKIKVNNEGAVFSETIIIPPGIHRLNFYSNAHQLIAPGDQRQLFFRIENLKWGVA